MRVVIIPDNKTDRPRLFIGKTEITDYETFAYKDNEKPIKFTLDFFCDEVHDFRIEKED